MKFDTAISLGSDCQSRYNLSRAIFNQKFGTYDGFNQKNSQIKNFDFGTYYFDWNISPIGSVIRILKNRFSEGFSLEKLEIFDLPNGSKSIINTQTGCMYPHLLQSYGQDISHESLEKYFPEIDNKYRYLANKTLAALESKKNILFVLHGNHSADRLNELVATLNEFSCDFKILLTPVSDSNNYSPETPTKLTDSNWIIKPIVHKPYPGDLLSWAKAFRDINFSLP